MSAHVVRGSVGKVYDRKVFDHSKLKILSPKQMLQRLPIALAQIKVGKTF